MKRFSQTVALFCLFFLEQACSPRQHGSRVFRSYEEALTPTVFAPELALNGNTYKGSFSSDFSHFYFFRHVQPDREDYRIFETRFQAGKWSDPTLLFPDSGSDLYPVVSTVDPQKLIFTSFRRTPADTSRRPNANFWQAKYRDKRWEISSPLDAANLVYNYNSQPCMTKRGDIYFTSNLPDWSATYTYKMRLQDGKYGQPEKFDFVNNLRLNDTASHYWEICMAPDESYLILTVSRGREGPKLFLAKKEGKSWAKPTYLGDILKTDMSGNFPYITSDGRFLIFTRDFSKFYILPTKAFL